jgi:hypothetical protein
MSFVWNHLFERWLDLWGQAGRPAGRKPRPAQRPRSALRPCLEVLEGRTLLSSTVSWTGMSTPPDSPPQSLEVMSQNPGDVAAGSVHNVASDGFLAAAGAPAFPTAGRPFSGLVATVTDTFSGVTAGGLQATIAWGDGHTSAGTVTDEGNGTLFFVSGTNSYAQAGFYTVSVTVRDTANDQSATAQGPAIVRALPDGVVLVHQHFGKKTKLVAEVSFTAGPPRDIVAPYQKPTYQDIAVAPQGLDGDGTFTALLFTARKGKRHVSTTVELVPLLLERRSSPLPLADRALPSAMPGSSGTVPGLDQTGHRLRLTGQVSGTWTPEFTLPDVGAMQGLTGPGKVKPLDAVQANGTLNLPGFVAQGEATGTLTLTNRRGSVTLALVGPPQPGFSGPPSSFHYTVAGATGAFAHATGSGTADFTETSAASLQFTLTFRARAGRHRRHPG